VPVAEALATGMRPGPPGPASAVARALVKSVLPEEDAETPPRWLLDSQHRSFKRALAAVRCYHGALLADPVGSGKTYVALAVARVLSPTRPIACLVPAPLVSQWRAAAARVGAAVDVGSHQQASRGRFPETRGGIVIIDESHHFRNPRTRRYRHAASWLMGRPTLLVTATPVVNRLEDLAHQLLLAVRDDALVVDGTVSLRALLASGAGAASVGRLVIEESPATGLRPIPVTRESRPSAEECEAISDALSQIDRLSLSRRQSIAALVRSVLRRAAGSSPAALLGALRRYRALLLHARDALATGRSVGRSEIRALIGDCESQLVFWEMFSAKQDDLELDLGDLAVIDSTLQRTGEWAGRGDGKVARLSRFLTDPVPSLIFVSRRETVRHLRDHLPGAAVAWCTGERAGVGRVSLPRAVVLGWFQTGGLNGTAPASLVPRHLVVTDVAAEGLDLQRAGRVIHYDLPWTPMRLAQREGRAVRLGSLHPRVEVIQFSSPPQLEAALHVERGLARKAALPGKAGLGREGKHLWGWRAELATRVGGGPEAMGTAVVSGGPPGLLAGFELHEAGSRNHLALALGWLDPEGAWSEERALVTARVIEAAKEEGVRPADPEELRRWLERLARPIRARIDLLSGRRWAGSDPDPGVRRLAAQLHLAVGDAARRRDRVRLARLERALAFIGGGHTAGEAAMIDRLAGSTGAEVDAWVPRAPAPTPRWGAIEVRLIGLVLFEE